MTPSCRRVSDPPGLPPADFDPVHNPADRARLEEFWLPPYPDPDREPELHEHWKEMFSGPLRFVLAGSQRAELPTTRPLPITRPARTPVIDTLATSSNWSGAYALPNRGDRFTRIVGRWKVPATRPGTDANPAALPFRCSIWIGLDGQRQWTKSMPQVGTEHTAARDGKREAHKLWWQCWLRDGRSAQHDIAGVPVQAGDVVLCSLIVVSPHEVRFHVKNRNTGAFAGLAVCEPVPLRGSSAEWIVERPADSPDNPQVVDGVLETGPFFPLPDYGSVLFERCVALAAAAPGGAARYHPMRTPRLICMSEILSQPTRSAVISMPRRRGMRPGSLGASYRAPEGS